MSKKKKENLWVDPLVNCNDVGLIMLQNAIKNLFDRSDNNFEASESAEKLLSDYRDNDEWATFWGPYEFDFNLLNRFVVEIHNNLPAQITAYLVTLLNSVDQAREAKEERDFAEQADQRWRHNDKIKELEAKIVELKAEKKSGSSGKKKKKGGK